MLKVFLDLLLRLLTRALLEDLPDLLRHVVAPELGP